jgi:hypothetical protein
MTELLAAPPDQALREHAAGCPRCAARIDEAAGLRAQLASLRESSAARVQGIDLAPRVLASLAAPPEAPRRRWLLAPLVAAALLLGWWLWPRGDRVEVSATEPVTAIGDGEPRQLRGERIAIATPVRLIASARGGATVAGGAAAIRLWPDSRLDVETPARLGGLAGGVSIAARDVLTLFTNTVAIRGRGRFEIETRRQGAPMTLTRNHKIGVAVVVAVVVTAGWITIESRRGTERIDAPGAAVVDDSGAVTRLLPPDWKVGSGRLAAGVAPEPGDGTGQGPVSGAYWDESSKRIIFALTGEVVDAASGAPIEAFDVEARALESKGFGAVSEVKRSFSDRAGGDFELNNVGLGIWQVTVRAADYAPSTQRVDLSDLGANPVLLFPLTGGARITGQVIDWRGQPVEGARVGQPECLERSDPKCSVVESDGDGRFDLPALPEDETFALRAEHPRYGFAESKNLRQDPGETRHVVIQLSGVLRVFGRVSRGDAAAPVAGAIITSDDGVVSATTDAAGEYEMFVPLGERPQVFVTGDPARRGEPIKIASYPNNRSSREVRWVEADTHVGELEIDFQLQMESAAIAGRVTDERGQPIAGARLRFTNAAGWKRRGHETFPTEAVTGAGGRYRLNDVPAHAGYVVHLVAESGPATQLGYVSVPAEIEVRADFALGSGAIRGGFVSKAGEPFAVPVCPILGARSRANVFHISRCPGADRFEFAGLPPGRYRLENANPQADRPFEIGSADVEVGPGEVVEGIEIVASGQQAWTWRLRILDEQGRFITGAFSRYRFEGTNFTSSLETGVDGITEITLSEALENLFIDAPGYQAVRLELGKLDRSEVIEVRMARVR